jgi:hypothetical protein
MEEEQVTQTLPFGVSYSRIVNFLSTLPLFAFGTGVLLALWIPNIMRLIQPGGSISTSIFAMLLGLVIAAFAFVPALLLIKINQRLKELNAQARIWQIAVSCFFLLAFPVGTLLYGISLYFMLADEKTKTAFASSQ